MKQAVGIVIAIAVFALLFLPSVICWLKGKRWWATIGFVTSWHWIPVFRLAKPHSWWAQRYYDEAKMERAHARYAPFPDPEIDAALDSYAASDGLDPLAAQDRTTRRAIKRAEKARSRL